MWLLQLAVLDVQDSQSEQPHDCGCGHQTIIIGVIIVHIVFAMVVSGIIIPSTIASIIATILASIISSIMSRLCLSSFEAC